MLQNHCYTACERRIKLLSKKVENEYNEKEDIASSSSSDWETPPFARIKKKKTKRLSPYLETELWERDEPLFIIMVQRL
jgi:hypothetical protein